MVVTGDVASMIHLRDRGYSELLEPLRGQSRLAERRCFPEGDPRRRNGRGSPDSHQSEACRAACFVRKAIGDEERDTGREHSARTDDEDELRRGESAFFHEGSPCRERMQDGCAVEEVNYAILDSRARWRNPECHAHTTRYSVFNR